MFGVIKVILFNLLLLLACCEENFLNQKTKYKIFEQILKDSTQLISKAISDVIHEFYITQNLTFDIIIYGEKSNHLSDVVDGIKSQNISTTIRHISKIDDWNHEMNKSAVIFVKSEADFAELHEKSKTKIFELPHLNSPTPENFKFFVYVEEIKNVMDINGLIDLNYDLRLPTDMRFFEFFITADDNFVNLSANLLYSEENCGNFNQKLLNAFDLNSQKWTEKLQSFNHYDNFHNCVLKFYTKNSYYLHFETNEDFLVTSSENSKDLKLAGINYHIIQFLSQKFNFTSRFLFDDEISGNATDYTHIAIDILNYGNVSNFFHYLQPVFVDNYHFIVSQNDFYTNYEKMLFPFDTTTWILILFTYGLTFGIIFGLQYSPKWIKNAFFGKDNKQPGYNALGAFFGVAFVGLPRESLSRYILIIYIWFCLIIRTCWQSMMFEFMTSDMRKPLPQTLDDLRELNYTIIMHETILFTSTSVLQELLNGRESPKVIIFYFDDDSIFNANFLDLYDQSSLGQTNSKFAFLMEAELYHIFDDYYNQSLPMQNEKISKSTGYFLPKNHILLLHMKKLFDELIPTGILEHLKQYSVWFLNRPIYKDPGDPRRILSIFDLEFGFVIFLAALFVSTIVFIYELHALYVEEQLRKLIGLYQFIRVIKERLRVYHDKW
ncbi:hypothetical protein PVAND_015846 [Polypedilum vanderplanki]|uniref:Ionotropic receptor n=1 Tax=Polypedilum vanderplanki TaxID=319348 RepID=A0A9J6BE50_POLVA|nr:hypothetical protein PVAND_015846 [Polypedilum vanderplanki]